MTLFADLWRNLLWCGMIGAALGLFISAISVMRSTPAPGSSPGLDIAAGVLVGIVMSVMPLGVPVCVWSVGHWIFAKPTPAQPVAQQNPSVPPPLPPTFPGALAHDASHGAVVGSTAAIPGAIAGGIGGILLVAGYVAIVGFISLATFNATWWNEVVNRGLIPWLAGFTIGGAIVGALTGMVLGGTVGAIFGGVRSAARRH